MQTMYEHEPHHRAMEATLTPFLCLAKSVKTMVNESYKDIILMGKMTSLLSKFRYDEDISEMQISLNVP